MEKKQRGISVGSLFFLGFLLFLIAACAAPLTELVPNYSTIRPSRIAILPAMNETSDLDAPAVFRILAKAELMIS